VILLPGIVLPAGLAYGALIPALGPDVVAVAKDLEVYTTPEPPEDYSLKRPAGIRAITHAFKRGDIDRRGPPPR
jgi:hypothetical protein